MSGLKEKVYANAEKLNSSDRDILNYIFDNPEECSEMKLSDLANELFVSESAIFRLCKKIGLSGFSELKFKLSELDNGLDTTDVNFTEQVNSVYVDTINYYNQLSLDSFYRRLDNAQTVYIYSTGWLQEEIANYLSHQLFVVGKSAVILPSAVDELRMSSSWKSSGDILFAISYSGDNQVMEDELKKIRLINSDYYVASISKVKENHLSSISDISFFFRTLSFNGINVSSKSRDAFSPVYLLIDLIINGYCEYKRIKG